MAVKKINHNSDEIDISELLKKWWSFRKLVIFGTLIVALLSSFVLIFYNNVLNQQKQNYVSAVIKSNFGDSSRIISAFKSKAYIEEALKGMSIELPPNDLTNNMLFLKSTDPLSKNLKDKIISLDEKTLRSLSLTDEALTSIIESLDNNSKDLVTIEFYHEQLNLSYEQSKNFILKLSDVVNRNLILRSTREAYSINKIDTREFDIFFNDAERLSRLSNIINSIQNNLSQMKSKYSLLLSNIDLEELSTLANISQKLLFEISKDLGNTIAIDTLNINISQKERDISDLKNSLEYLDTQRLETFKSEAQKSEANVSSPNTTLDGQVFDKILTIGSTINLNSFRLKTVENIQLLQKQKSELITQKDLLNLPFEYELYNDELTLEMISERIFFLVDKINKVSEQILDLTEPKNAIEVLANPELIELNSKPIAEYIKYVLILSILGFFIISLISILIPARR
jgi:hypothetical protein